jgi:hypothetical protein
MTSHNGAIMAVLCLILGAKADRRRDQRLLARALVHETATQPRAAPVRLRFLIGHPSTQLLVFGFGADSDFEGQLVGALERMEAGGTLRVLEALFVGREAETGEVVAIAQPGRRSGGLVAALVGARLDAAERRHATERALAADTTGVPAEAIRELAGALQPGHAVAAVLVEHVWALTLHEALARMDGTLLSGEFVDATELRHVAGEVLTAARRRHS